MMLEGWRWYGPDDPVSLDDVRQAGATDIVSALHQVPIGEAWTRKAVEERKNLIENGQPGRSQLTWSVVESIPVPDDVKRLGAKATRSIEAWIASLEAVAAAGIKIICYNFMCIRARRSSAASINRLSRSRQRLPPSLPPSRR